MEDNRTLEVSRQPGAYQSTLYHNYKAFLLKLIENFVTFCRNLAGNDYAGISNGTVMLVLVMPIS